MKYSQLPFKTSKTISKDQSKNAKFLEQAGFIYQEAAGIYAFLPLGLRVLNKIEQIVREEMDKIGIEVYLTSLAPMDNWEKTGRKETVDVLMKTIPANKLAQAKNDTEYILNSTHEEMITPIVSQFNKSYRDFPIAVYQIQTKFRNEPRAKTGLLRCREFRMKDLYSFHTSEEDLKKYYEKVKEAYWKIFERLGIGKQVTKYTLASGGDFTKDYSHEFQTICSSGEDIIFYDKSEDICFNREVAPSLAPSIDDKGGELLPLKEVEGKGIVGVEELSKFLNIPVAKSTKTILFEIDTGEVVAAAVRGGYDINEEKLIKILGCKSLKLASAETVRKVTGAEVGYAGILNLPNQVKVYFDDSTAGRINFETGANKTNYHTINVNFGRDLPNPEQFYDFKVAKEGDIYPQTGESYEVYKACEVGNIFPLGLKFSKAFGYMYTDEKGQQQPVYMGSYGLGPSRVMGVLVEKFADEKGLVWPDSVAPFKVHLIGLDLVDEAIFEKAEHIYKLLLSEGIEVLFDDRVDVSPGAKFADADLIGIPYRVVVSKRSEEDKFEVKKRNEADTSFKTTEQLIALAK